MQKVRTIKDDYDKNKSSMKKNNGMFKFSENFNLDNEIINVERDIAKWFEKYCDNNVLEYKNIKLSEVIKRSKYKMAPFIIVIRDLKFQLFGCLNYKLNSYKKIVLFRNDRTGFIKQKKRFII